MALSKVEIAAQELAQSGPGVVLQRLGQRDVANAGERPESRTVVLWARP